MFSPSKISKGFAWENGISLYDACGLTWWNSSPIILKNKCNVSTTTNSKGMLRSGGIVQPFLAAVVERWHNQVHSDSFLSIGQSSTGKRSHNIIYFYYWLACCWLCDDEDEFKIQNFKKKFSLLTIKVVNLVLAAITPNTKVFRASSI